jgi:O-antigen/teichoic acid export membrane protein
MGIVVLVVGPLALLVPCLLTKRGGRRNAMAVFISVIALAFWCVAALCALGASVAQGDWGIVGGTAMAALFACYVLSIAAFIVFVFWRDSSPHE